MKATVNDLNSTEWKSPKEEFPFVVRVLEKGNMEVMTVSMSNGECLQVDVLLEKTKKPGQYSAFWGTYLMYIYELPVMDHYIFYSESQFFEQKVYVGELIGKDPTENYEALEDFKKFAKQKGFPQENIIVPEQRDMCSPKDHFAAPQNCKP
ncbi:vomeronasal secretory protein 2-like [Peromyscus eremicus]|uniref:vomeronasal secretory protein 2-like n=1 Tax=Peromyscus eremicus TaxID=42410 RepID=UPI0027DDDFA4|nr:vomeronasal secretory protein 2-like [Peromyscus eremicus]